MSDIQNIIERSTFHRAGTYLYVRASAVRNPESHLMVTRDDRELTVVTTEEQLEDVDVIERNPDRWTLLTIDCANPFYCVGFIAKISARLSAAGIDILVVSTFSRDWVMVKDEDADLAATLLREIGFHEL
ncbi:MAG TPA: ACT domain-containing protein [Thermoanaerobaculia bacterium]|nr:ACT domain-containing protein [Thermoanaerobaculia bacterium]